MPGLSGWPNLEQYSRTSELLLLLHGKAARTIKTNYRSSNSIQQHSQQAKQSMHALHVNMLSDPGYIPTNPRKEWNGPILLLAVFLLLYTSAVRLPIKLLSGLLQLALPVQGNHVHVSIFYR